MWVCHPQRDTALVIREWDVDCKIAKIERVKVISFVHLQGLANVAVQTKYPAVDDIDD